MCRPIDNANRHAVTCEFAGHRHSDWAGADDQDGHVHGDFPVSSDLGVKASLCSSSRPILAERRRFERVNSVVFHNENLSASLVGHPSLFTRDSAQHRDSRV